MKNIVLLIIFLLSIPYLQSCKSQQQEKNIETVSMKLEIDTKASGHEMCDSFKLTKDDIEAYFSLASEVDENEFHHDAMILPCKYIGTIKIRGEVLQWEIYAGGAGYLYSNKTVNKRYLCKQKCCDALKGLC